MKKPKKSTNFVTMEYTIFYTPQQEEFVINNLPFVNTAIADWNGENYTVVQELNEAQVDECFDACSSQLIAGIKPGSHPAGHPSGQPCQK